MSGMRNLSLTLGLACVVCCVACGGRTGNLDDTPGATGAEGGTGGSVATQATGGNIATIAGGSGVTNGVGGRIATNGTGGSSAGPPGGRSATSATGGKSAGSMGGSGVTKATGGSPSAPTGGAANATGGKSAGSMGGSGATIAVGGGTTKATGGSSAGSMGGSGATIATGGSAASGGTTSTGGTSSTVITTCNDTFPFLGTWEGNILDFYFEPQEALKLELSADASGVITGKVTWGDGAPPPPPQGADIPYPPGYWEQQTNMMPFMPPPDPWPGFAYTIVRGAGCDTTFRFGVSTYELWQDWCALQTPIDSGSFGWGCTLLGGGGSSDGTTCTINGQNGESQTYPLWKCEACGSFGMNGLCACDQNGCFANTTATLTFDLTYSVSSDGTEILSGPDPDSSCSNCTARLARQN